MKNLFTAVLIMITGTGIFAQEQSVSNPPPPQQEAPSIPGIPGEVKLPMGILNIHGMALTGLRGQSKSQEGLTDPSKPGGDSPDGVWRVDAINPTWAENRFDLHLDYSFLNYGAFLTTRFQSWAANSFDSDGAPDLRYAFVYAKFLDEKIKLSLGRLTDNIFAIPEMKVWQTEGAWDMFNFTEDAKDTEDMSLRLEVKPIPQLNVGAQYFFVRPDGVGMWDKYWDENFAGSGVWKEVGFAAEWKSDLFNAVAGVRFDSKGDILNKYEGYTYLRTYYGDSDYLGSALAPTNGPRYKYASEVIGQYDASGKRGDDPGFDGASRAFFGFSVKAVENLDIIAQGGFYNIPTWDKFGYGRFNELVCYNNLGVKGLSLGLIMSQEFYGNDVFPDDMKNSPFMTFAPEVSYALFDIPGFQLKGTLTGTYGIAPDVTDLYLKVKPAINLMIGAFLVDIFYEVESIRYADGIRYPDGYDMTLYQPIPGAQIEPETKHTIGLAIMMIF